MRLRNGLATIVLSLSTVLGCEFLESKPQPQCFNCNDAQLPKKNNKYSPESYIRGDGYKSLLIEIDSVEGVNPINEDDLRLVEQVLSRIIDKPKGISHKYSDVGIHSSKKVYQIADLEALAAKYRSYGRDSLSLYVLYLDGEYYFNSIAGVALDDGTIFIFRENVPESLDKCIFMHEAGHQFGLVGIIPQQRVHEDSGHHQHDSNDLCVMFYKLTNPLNYLFDRQCLEDIAAVRKK